MKDSHVSIIVILVIVTVLSISVILLHEANLLMPDFPKSFDSGKSTLTPSKELKFEINGRAGSETLTLYIENLNDFDVHNVKVSVDAYCESRLNTEYWNEPMNFQKDIADIRKRETATVIFTSDLVYDFYKYTITIGTSEGTFTCELQ